MTFLIYILKIIIFISMLQKNGMVLLQVASENENNEAIKILLLKGIDINVGKKRGNTTLKITCRNNHYYVAELLLKINK